VPQVTLIHFVRHGLVHNPRQVFYGRLPRFALSAEGQQQAQSVARRLAKERLAAIYSSPRLRAQQTGRAIAALHPGCTVNASRLLDEVYVPIEGRPLSEGIARGWDLYTGNQAPHEGVSDILERMMRFVTRVRRDYSGQQVVAVTHGDPIGFLMLWAWGVPVTAANKAPLYRDYLAEGSITTFAFSAADGNELPRMSYTPPHESLERAAVLPEHLTKKAGPG